MTDCCLTDKGCPRPGWLMLFGEDRCVFRLIKKGVTAGKYLNLLPLFFSKRLYVTETLVKLIDFKK